MQIRDSFAESSAVPLLGSDLYMRWKFAVWDSLVERTYERKGKLFDRVKFTFRHSRMRLVILSAITPCQNSSYSVTRAIILTTRRTEYRTESLCDTLTSPDCVSGIQNHRPPIGIFTEKSAR